MSITLTEKIFQTMKLTSRNDLLSYLTVKRSLVVCKYSSQCIPEPKFEFEYVGLTCFQMKVER